VTQSTLPFIGRSSRRSRLRIDVDIDRAKCLTDRPAADILYSSSRTEAHLSVLLRIKGVMPMDDSSTGITGGNLQ